MGNCQCLVIACTGHEMGAKLDKETRNVMCRWGHTIDTDFIRFTYLLQGPYKFER